MALRLVPAWLIGIAACALPWLVAFRQSPLLPRDPDAPGQLFVLVACAGLGAWVARTDGWLGAFVAYAALAALWTDPVVHPVSVVVLIALGAVALVWVRRLPRRHRGGLRLGVLALAVGQVAYQCAQSVGVDPAWAGRPLTDGRIPGTMGHPIWLGSLLALVGPLAPLWLLPVFALGLWLAKAKLAMLALGAGLVVRRSRVLGLALAAAGALVLWRSSWDSLGARVRVWRLALGWWWREARWLGFGPGSWWEAVPGAQVRAGVYPTEHFRKAHNELVQLAFEFGLVGLGLLAGWCWHHRDAVAGHSGGALVALAIVSLGMFPFHVAQVAAPALVILGLATAEPAR